MLGHVIFYIPLQNNLSNYSVAIRKYMLTRCVITVLTMDSIGKNHPIQDNPINSPSYDHNLLIYHHHQMMMRNILQWNQPKLTLELMN